jgi:hypothetical protein
MPNDPRILPVAYGGLWHTGGEVHAEKLRLRAQVEALNAAFRMCPYDPSNPTGLGIPRETLDQWGAFVSKFDGFIAEDDDAVGAYHDATLYDAEIQEWRRIQNENCANPLPPFDTRPAPPDTGPFFPPDTTSTIRTAAVAGAIGLVALAVIAVRVIR